MQELVLNGRSLPGFAHLIPERLRPEVAAGALVGVGIVDEWHDNEAVGVLLCREIYDWMEIVWLCVAPDYLGERCGEWILRGRIWNAKYRGSVCGVFADLPGGAARAPVEALLTRLGFTLRQVGQGVYSAPLGELEKVELLRRAPAGGRITPLGKAGSGLLRDAVRAVRQDRRPTPLPDPVDWTRYDGELSMVCRRGEEVQGLLLFTRGGGTITMECAWAGWTGAVVGMLSAALGAGGRLCPPETEVVIPTVSGASAGLVEKLIPGAVSQRTDQALLYFTNAQEVVIDG